MVVSHLLQLQQSAHYKGTTKMVLYHHNIVSNVKNVITNIMDVFH